MRFKKYCLLDDIIEWVGDKSFTCFCFGILCCTSLTVILWLPAGDKLSVSFIRGYYAFWLAIPTGTRVRIFDRLEGNHGWPGTVRKTCFFGKIMRLECQNFKMGCDCILRRRRKSTAYHCDHRGLPLLNRAQEENNKWCGIDKLGNGLLQWGTTR